MAKYELDLYALAYPGQLSPVPYRDPLEAAERFWSYTEALGDPLRWCKTCENWSSRQEEFEQWSMLGWRTRERLSEEGKEVFPPSSDMARRPSGTVDRSSCAGCLFSYADAVEDSGPTNEERDMLRSMWIEAKLELEDVEAVRAHKRNEKEVKEWKRERAKAVEALRKAAAACKTAGFVPRNGRSWTRRSGEPGPSKNLTLEVKNPKTS